MCERTLRHLTSVIMEDPESDGFAEGYCHTQCATSNCNFYWEGQEVKVKSKANMLNSTFVLRHSTFVLDHIYYVIILV